MANVFERLRRFLSGSEEEVTSRSIDKANKSVSSQSSSGEGESSSSDQSDVIQNASNIAAAHQTGEKRTQKKDSKYVILLREHFKASFGYLGLSPSSKSKAKNLLTWEKEARKLDYEAKNNSDEIAGEQANELRRLIDEYRKKHSEVNRLYSDQFQIKYPGEQPRALSTHNDSIPSLPVRSSRVPTASLPARASLSSVPGAATNTNMQQAQSPASPPPTSVASQSTYALAPENEAEIDRLITTYKQPSENHAEASSSAVAISTVASVLPQNGSQLPHSDSSITLDNLEDLISRLGSPTPVAMAEQQPVVVNQGQAQTSTPINDVYKDVVDFLDAATAARSTPTSRISSLSAQIIADPAIQVNHAAAAPADTGAEVAHVHRSFVGNLSSYLNDLSSWKPATLPPVATSSAVISSSENNSAGATTTPVRASTSSQGGQALFPTPQNVSSPFQRQLAQLQARREEEAAEQEKKEAAERAEKAAKNLQINKSLNANKDEPIHDIELQWMRKIRDFKQEDPFYKQFQIEYQAAIELASNDKMLEASKKFAEAEKQIELCLQNVKNYPKQFKEEYNAADLPQLQGSIVEVEIDYLISMLGDEQSNVEGFEMLARGYARASQHTGDVPIEATSRSMPLASSDTNLSLSSLTASDSTHSLTSPAARSLDNLLTAATSSPSVPHQQIKVSKNLQKDFDKSFGGFFKRIFSSPSTKAKILMEWQGEADRLKSLNEHPQGDVNELMKARQIEECISQYLEKNSRVAKKYEKAQRVAGMNDIANDIQARMSFEQGEPHNSLPQSSAVGPASALAVHQTAARTSDNSASNGGSSDVDLDLDAMLSRVDSPSSHKMSNGSGSMHSSDAHMLSRLNENVHDFDLQQFKIIVINFVKEDADYQLYKMNISNGHSLVKDHDYERAAIAFTSAEVQLNKCLASVSKYEGQFHHNFNHFSSEDNQSMQSALDSLKLRLEDELKSIQRVKKLAVSEAEKNQQQVVDTHSHSRSIFYTSREREGKKSSQTQQLPDSDRGSSDSFKPRQ